MTARTWDAAREIDQQWLLWHLAKYVAGHQNPRAFAARLTKRHGPELVPKLRERLKAGPPDEPAP